RCVVCAQFSTLTTCTAIQSLRSLRLESSKGEQKVPTDRPTGQECSGSTLRKADGDQLAGGLGFEPRFSESESDVLPLNYPPAGRRKGPPKKGARRAPDMGQTGRFDKSR